MTELPWNTGKEYYDLHSRKIFSQYPFFHATMIGTSAEEFAEYLSARIQPDTDSLIADLGCGSGYMTDRLSQICRCVGVSNSEECISQCRLNYPDRNFVVADMSEFSLPGASHYIFLESIGYSDINKSMMNAFKNLRSGGVMYIKDIFYRDRFNQKQMENCAHWENFFKYRTTRVAEFVSMAENNGFELCEFRDVSDKVNLSIYYETLKLQLVPFEYPHSEEVIHIAGEFIFRKPLSDTQ